MDEAQISAAELLQARADEFLAGAAEIGGRHGVDEATTLAVMALQASAMLDGCGDAVEALDWALQRGYIEPAAPAQMGRRTGRTGWPYRVTDAGLRFAAGLAEQMDADA